MLVWVLWRTSLHEVFEPGVDIFKRLGICDVVHDAAAVGATVERRTEALEPLLPSSIPDLQNADTVIFELYLSVSEIGAYGWLKVLGEVSFLEEMNQRRFSNSRIANDD